jgi:hypothetical protein
MNPFITDDDDLFISFVARHLEVGQQYKLGVSFPNRGIPRGQQSYGATRRYTFSQQDNTLAELNVGCQMDKDDLTQEGLSEYRAGRIEAINNLLTGEKVAKETGYGNFTCYGMLSLEGVVRDYQVNMNRNTDVYEVIRYMDLTLDPKSATVNGEKADTRLPRILIPLTPETEKSKDKLRFGKGSELVVRILSKTGVEDIGSSVVPNEAYTFQYVAEGLEKDGIPSARNGQLPSLNENDSGEFVDIGQRTIVKRESGILYHTEDPEAVKAELLEKDLPENIKALLKPTRKGTLL